MPYQVFTTSGNWTVPLTADPSSVQVYATGEGGLSGTATSGSFSGGGGGSGAIAGEPALGGLFVGSVLSFIIGQGGSSTNTAVTGGSVPVTAAHGGNASGFTAGTAGAAGSNTLAIAGSAGGSGVVGSSKGGGSGAGSPGSTGSGGAGLAGGAADVSGGAAGSGAAGPPSLAGAQGGTGGAPTHTGTAGTAPGAGGGGPGNSATRAANNGAPGQVVIIWNTLNGVGLPVAMVSIGALTLTPSPSSLKVTATAGGSTANGIRLAVRVLDNAALPTPPNTQTGTGSTTAAADVAITPEATGSLAYSAVAVTSSTTPAAATGNTSITAGSGLGAFVSTATLTGNTPFTAGSSSMAVGGVAAVEVMPFGGSISTDASTPAVAVNGSGTTVTTAAFAPPTGGKLLLALVSAQGGTGNVTMAISDTFGLTWTEAIAAADTGTFYAGVWYAYSPAGLSFADIAPVPGMVSTPYSFTLTGAGGYGNYGWSVATGSLPVGLSLNGSTGVISGTPTVAGVSTFTLTLSDGFGDTLTSGSVSIVINEGFTGSGNVRQGWTAAAMPYTYGTLEIPVGTTEHDWVFVSVSWQASEDNGIAYCADNVHNPYQPVAYTTADGVMTQVFAVPDARAASTIYVSTSVFVRWLTVLVLDVMNLEPGFVVDAVNVQAGGPALSFTESASTTRADFILSVGAFQGAPQAVTQAGSGATWTQATWGGINGSSTAGITQAAAWAATSGSASPSSTFTAANTGLYSGCMVAVRAAGGLPVNDNPAWPVIKCQAAFGYIPHLPTVPPTWTDITTRYLGLNGQEGRSFEQDEIAAADLTLTLDNFDGALSPGGSYGADLITPVQLIATWQGRTYVIFRGIMLAIPLTYDFQRGMIKVEASDFFSKLPQSLLAPAMIQEMLYDQPLDLWPLNEEQGATLASNWSGRSAATLTSVASSGNLGTSAPTGGAVPQSQLTVNLFGRTLPVSEAAALAFAEAQQAIDSGSATTTAGTTQSSPPPTPTVPTTGFGNSMSGVYPAALMGTQDSTWGNSTVASTGTYYQATVLVDSGDITLPLTTTGATYSVWSQMYFIAQNTSAVIMALTDQNGTGGGKEYLAVSYNGTNVTVSQTAGSVNFTPPAYLFDSRWHLWTVTVSTAGLITLYLDGVVLGTLAGTFPAGSPTLLQWGGDTTASSFAAAGIFTGNQYLAGVFDRAVDPERIQTWFLSGATGYLNELGGTRIQRVLTWANWNAPQAVDPGLSLQQQFNYLTGGYGSSGLTGAIGNFNTAGGAIGVDSGAQADMTIQDIANTENGLVFMTADGAFAYRERDRLGNFPLGLALGDMDYGLNQNDLFSSGLGEWTTAAGCTVALSSGWSYANENSGLMTVTSGTPLLDEGGNVILDEGGNAIDDESGAGSASVSGGRFTATAGELIGFSGWVMSPQGCSVNLAINWLGSSGILSTTSGTVTVCPPMTPVFLTVPATAAPAGTLDAQGVIVISGGAGPGTQLYFDRTRLSPAGFQCPYEDNVEITIDVQYLFNDIAITRNVDQAGYRVNDATSRSRYYPRVNTRTIYSSTDDANAMGNCANFLLSAYAYPKERVSTVVIDAALNPEAWPFVLSAGIGDTVPFTRSPVGAPAITGSFVVLSIEPDLAPDKAQFTYVLAPSGVF